MGTLFTGLVLMYFPFLLAAQPAFIGVSPSYLLHRVYGRFYWIRFKKAARQCITYPRVHYKNAVGYFSTVKSQLIFLTDNWLPVHMGIMCLDSMKFQLRNNNSVYMISQTPVFFILSLERYCALKTSGQILNRYLCVPYNQLKLKLQIHGFHQSQSHSLIFESKYKSYYNM